MAGAGVTSVVVALSAAIPLTTTFTPPWACFADIYTIGPSVDQDHDDTLPANVSAAGPRHWILRGPRYECYPRSFSVSAMSYNYTESRIGTGSTTNTTETWLAAKTMLSQVRLYSPGICPQGYVPRTQDVTGMNTYQTCCPR